MRDYPMTEAIADREYEFVADGKDEVIHVRIGKPASTSDTPHPAWYCPWTVQDRATTKKHAAVGEDSLQALLLALSGLRTDLRLIAKKGKLTAMGGIEGPYIDLA